MDAMKYQKLLSEFEGQLDALESGNGDILFKAEKGIVLVEKCIRKLQKQITGKPFASQADEIYFSSTSSPKYSVSSFITSNCSILKARGPEQRYGADQIPTAPDQ